MPKKIKDILKYRKLEREIIKKHEKEIEERFFESLDKYFDAIEQNELIKNVIINDTNSDEIKLNKTEYKAPVNGMNKDEIQTKNDINLKSNDLKEFPLNPENQNSNQYHTQNSNSKNGLENLIKKNKSISNISVKDEIVNLPFPNTNYKHVNKINLTLQIKEIEKEKTEVKNYDKIESQLNNFLKISLNNETENIALSDSNDKTINQIDLNIPLNVINKIKSEVIDDINFESKLNDFKEMTDEPKILYPNPYLPQKTKTKPEFQSLILKKKSASKMSVYNENKSCFLPDTSDKNINEIYVKKTVNEFVKEKTEILNDILSLQSNDIKELNPSNNPNPDKPEFRNSIPYNIQKSKTKIELNNSKEGERSVSKISLNNNTEYLDLSDLIDKNINQIGLNKSFNGINKKKSEVIDDMNFESKLNDFKELSDEPKILNPCPYLPQILKTRTELVILNKKSVTKSKFNNETVSSQLQNSNNEDFFRKDLTNQLADINNEKTEIINYNSVESQSNGFKVIPENESFFRKQKSVSKIIDNEEFKEFFLPEANDKIINQIDLIAPVNKESFEKINLSSFGSKLNSKKFPMKSEIKETDMLIISEILQFIIKNIEINEKSANVLPYFDSVTQTSPLRNSNHKNISKKVDKEEYLINFVHGFKMDTSHNQQHHDRILGVHSIRESATNIRQKAEFEEESPYLSYENNLNLNISKEQRNANVYPVEISLSNMPFEYPKISSEENKQSLQTNSGNKLNNEENQNFPEIVERNLNNNYFQIQNQVNSRQNENLQISMENIEKFSLKLPKSVPVENKENDYYNTSMFNSKFNECKSFLNQNINNSSRPICFITAHKNSSTNLNQIDTSIPRDNSEFDYTENNVSPYDKCSSLSHTSSIFIENSNEEFKKILETNSQSRAREDNKVFGFSNMENDENFDRNDFSASKTMIEQNSFSNQNKLISDLISDMIFHVEFIELKQPIIEKLYNIDEFLNNNNNLEPDNKNSLYASKINISNNWKKLKSSVKKENNFKSLNSLQTKEKSQHLLQTDLMNVNNSEEIEKFNSAFKQALNETKIYVSVNRISSLMEKIEQNFEHKFDGNDLKPDTNLINDKSISNSKNTKYPNEQNLIFNIDKSINQELDDLRAQNIYPQDYFKLPDIGTKKESKCFEYSEDKQIFCRSLEKNPTKYDLRCEISHSDTSNLSKTPIFNSFTKEKSNNSFLNEDSLKNYAGFKLQSIQNKPNFNQSENNHRINSGINNLHYLPDFKFFNTSTTKNLKKIKKKDNYDDFNEKNLKGFKLEEVELKLPLIRKNSEKIENMRSISAANSMNVSKNVKIDLYSKSLNNLEYDKFNLPLIQHKKNLNNQLTTVPKKTKNTKKARFW